MNNEINKINKKEERDFQNENKMKGEYNIEEEGKLDEMKNQKIYNNNSKRVLNGYEIPIGEEYILDARKKLFFDRHKDIYAGRRLKDNKEIIIKLEPTHAKHPVLFYECKTAMFLEGGPGIPNVLWCGSQGNYNIEILDIIGRSLEDLFNDCNRKFTLLTTLMIVDQMLRCIEFIHSKNFIHRNLKPEDFFIDQRSNKHQIYTIELYLAKRYRDPKTGLHIPYKDGKSSLEGTARYASINTLLGIEQSRRDDIEALGYILVYFTKGKLPWSGLKSQTREEKYMKIGEKKISTGLEVLCEGLPEEFKAFIQYARELKFDSRPDYGYLKNLIRKVCVKNQLTFDFNKFDWIIREKKK